MSVVGLIVEYNPFHNGHLYHLEQSIKLSKADYVVCVMSGNFIQRGEPAIVNKWARAKMALLSGIDLVIELPVVYAMSSAEFFAFGAVKILNSLGIVDYLCFGSEYGKIDELEMIANILINEPEEYRAFLKENLRKGLSYPAAREEALCRYLPNIQAVHARNIRSIMSSPNNILGIEYLKALKKIRSSILPLTIRRIANSYHSEQITGSISSATAVRKIISDNINTANIETSDLKQTVSEQTLKILKEEFVSGRGPVFPSHFENLILAALRKVSISELQNLIFVSEGLENRIKIASANSGSIDELLEQICTKRYTKTRIQRILFNALISISSHDFQVLNENGGPQYIRVLGFNEKGRHLLSQINKTCTLPVIIKAADFKNSPNPLIKRMLEIEAAATDIYVLGYSNPAFKKGGQEFTQNIIRI